MKYIWGIALLLFLISCRKFKFSQAETIIMNTYNVGDTLKFQSLLTGKIKTYVITEKQDYIGREGDINSHRAHFGKIVWKDLDHKNATGQDIFVEITNSKNGNDIFLNGGYLPDNFGSLNKTDTLLVNNKKIIDYYKVTILNSGGDEIIWQQKYGLVKYNYINNEVFVRINMP